MTLADHLTWSVAPLYGVGVAYVALAVWLYVLNPRASVHRAFALYLLLVGITDIAVGLRNTSADPGLEAAFQGVHRVGFMLALVAMIWFMLVYPRPRTALGTRRIILSTLLAGVVFTILARAFTGTGLSSADTTWFGPLFTIAISVPGFVAFAFARDLGAPRSDREHKSLRLVVAAFVVYPVYRGVVAGFLLRRDLPEVSGLEAQAILILEFAMHIAGNLFALAAAWLLARDGHARNGSRLGVVLLVLAAGLIAVAREVAGLSILIALGTVDAALPVLVVYALLRHQLFGIDVKVKWTIKQSTVAAIFIGLFFVVSESAAAFFSDRVGTYMGIVAAGALVFAIAPLQHFAQRVADKAMPGVKGVGDMDDDERRRVYAEAAAEAWADGSLTRQERALLVRLQTALGIAADEAQRLEQEVAGQ